MTPYEAAEAMRALLEEMRRTRFVPDETRDRGKAGLLGFDYGYQQALSEVQAKLYRAFPDHAVAAARLPPQEP